MLCQEYRLILSDIPSPALVNQPVDLDNEKTLNCFYRYFDLANGEFFMAKCGRVRQDTWKYWQEGIQDNLKLVAFKKAWQKIEPKLAGYNTKSFCFFCGLRWLIDTHFEQDQTEFNYDKCKPISCKKPNCGMLADDATKKPQFDAAKASRRACLTA
jgi:hypothetical protein